MSHGASTQPPDQRWMEAQQLAALQWDTETGSRVRSSSRQGRRDARAVSNLCQTHGAEIGIAEQDQHERSESETVPDQAFREPTDTEANPAIELITVDGTTSVSGLVLTSLSNESQSANRMHGCLDARNGVREPTARPTGATAYEKPATRGPLIRRRPRRRG